MPAARDMHMDMHNITAQMAAELASFPARLRDGVQMLAGGVDHAVATTPADIIYREDKMGLLHYHPTAVPADHHPTPVVIVYALINRYIMLDLEPGRSFVQNLLNAGLDLYLIDWGRPTAADRFNDLDDYLNGYLDTAIDRVRAHSGSDRVNLMGICMGGTFAVIYTALHPSKVKNLITLATPTDFDVPDATLFLWAKQLDADQIVGAFGCLPGDLANILYLLAVPVDTLNKYINFLRRIDNRKFVSTFLRMEKWIFDSPDMPAAVARQFIGDLLQENRLIQNRLSVGRHRVDLGHIRCPLLNVYGRTDFLAPPAACTPLADAVGSVDATTLGVDSGHVGIFVGSMSHKTICPRIVEWIRQR
jgi:polyhydroxyalkanoate synthase